MLDNQKSIYLGRIGPVMCEIHYILLRTVVPSQAPHGQCRALRNLLDNAPRWQPRLHSFYPWPQNMTLGAQCWSCKWRRVRCDSQHPGCSKCAQKGIQCPGYSTIAPLKWRHRVTRSQCARSPQSPSSTLLSTKDIAPAEVVLESITYCKFT